MFDPAEAADGGASFATELEAEVAAECAKLGAVEKVGGPTARCQQGHLVSNWPGLVGISLIDLRGSSSRWLSLMNAGCVLQVDVAARSCSCNPGQQRFQHTK